MKSFTRWESWPLVGKLPLIEKKTNISHTPQQVFGHHQCEEGAAIIPPSVFG